MKHIRLIKTLALVAFGLVLMDKLSGGFTVPESIKSATQPLQVRWVPESL